jgi:uncharacterized protein with GYD domain
MPKYVCLVSFTQQGLKNLGATTKRAEALQKHAEKMGVKVIHTFWTVGQYDLVHVLDAPDDRTAAGLAFSLGAVGNVRTETMRAFDREEMTEILEKVITPYDLLRE